MTETSEKSSNIWILFNLDTASGGRIEYPSPKYPYFFLFLQNCYTTNRNKNENKKKNKGNVPYTENWDALYLQTIELFETGAVIRKFLILSFFRVSLHDQRRICVEQEEFTKTRHFYIPDVPFLIMPRGFEYMYILFA